MRPQHMFSWINKKNIYLLVEREKGALHEEIFYSDKIP